MRRVQQGGQVRTYLKNNFIKLLLTAFILTRLKTLLSDIYDTSENPGKIIIFVETKRRVDNLVRFIRSFGVRCGAIHGDKSQSERDFVLREFRSGKSNILVATDVAARGLGKFQQGVGHIHVVVVIGGCLAFEDHSTTKHTRLNPFPSFTHPLLDVTQYTYSLLHTQTYTHSHAQLPMPETSLIPHIDVKVKQEQISVCDINPSKIYKKKKQTVFSHKPNNSQTLIINNNFYSYPAPNLAPVPARPNNSNNNVCASLHTLSVCVSLSAFFSLLSLSSFFLVYRGRLL